MIPSIFCLYFPSNFAVGWLRTCMFHSPPLFAFFPLALFHPHPIIISNTRTHIIYAMVAGLGIEEGPPPSKPTSEKVSYPIFLQIRNRMAGCLDSLPHQLYFDWDTKRNTYSAIAAGFLFFLAWWLMIDTAVVYTREGQWNNWYFALALAGTFTMFIVNSVSNSAIQGNYIDEGVFGAKGARLWLMFGFIASFACIVAGIWIMFGDYVLHQGDGPKWPGIALFLHAFFIFLSSLIYKFGRTEELWE